MCPTSNIFKILDLLLEPPVRREVRDINLVFVSTRACTAGEDPIDTTIPGEADGRRVARTGNIYIFSRTVNISFSENIFAIVSLFHKLFSYEGNIKLHDSPYACRSYHSRRALPLTPSSDSTCSNTLTSDTTSRTTFHQVTGAPGYRVKSFLQTSMYLSVGIPFAYESAIASSATLVCMLGSSINGYPSTRREIYSRGSWATAEGM